MLCLTLKAWPNKLLIHAGDCLDAMLAAWKEDTTGMITEDSVIDTLVSLLFAGYDTCVNDPCVVLLNKLQLLPFYYVTIPAVKFSHLCYN